MKEFPTRDGRESTQGKAAAETDSLRLRTQGAPTWVADSPRIVAQQKTLQRMVASSTSISAASAASRAGNATAQRMKITGSSQGVDVCHFQHDEEQPDKHGLYRGDGYVYTLRGGDATGAIFDRQLASYQNAPSTEGRSMSQAGYGTFGAASGRGRGGTVTANPSPHFPSEGVLDQATYSQQGYSRIIGAEEVADMSVASGLSKLESGKRMASSLAASVRGADYATEHEERERLLPPDPRVPHYLATHKPQSLAESGASAGVSLLTSGISGIAQKGVQATNFASLGAQFGVEAKRLEAQHEELRKNAHGEADLHGLTDQELIGALAALEKHYATRTLTTGLSAIPFHIGTVVGALDTARTTAMGHGEYVEDALRTIMLHASTDPPHESALKVADLLGVPREFLTASGGLEVLKSRL